MAKDKKKNKKFKPIPYRDFPSTVDSIPQPKGKFVNPFRAMRIGWAEAEREAEAAHARRQARMSSNQPTDTAAHTHTEANPMPKDKNKKLKPIPYRDMGRTETLHQPKGEFVDLFKIMQERAVAKRAAKAARSRQQGQTSE